MAVTTNLPVAVIGAGPVGLAAAAHLLERGLEPLIFEAGPTAGAAIEQWRHIRLFSPWRFNIDAAAVRLLEASGWEAPRPTALPYGGELIDKYLTPLAALPADRPRLQTGARVIAVTRQGMDKTHTRDRGHHAVPASGSNTRTAKPATTPWQRVIDASGTWSTRNPLGTSGLPAIGEDAAADRISSPLPDVTGRDRAAFAGRRVLVVGAGHSAANTLINLADLAKERTGHPDPVGRPGRLRREGLRRRRRRRAARPRPARRPAAPPRRGRNHRTAHRLRHRRPQIPGLAASPSTSVDGRTLEADVVVPCTGFRPDLDILRELRLNLDPAVEAPT